MSTTNTNTGNNPATDYTNWKDISGGRNVVQTTDATITPITTIAMAENSMITIEAKVSGFKSDYSASCSGFLQYSARRVAGGAIEVAAPIVNILTDSGSSPTVDADVDGNNLRILVTGVAAETWNWNCSHQHNFIV